MDFEKIEIDLNNEDVHLMEDIQKLQKEMDEIEPNKMNRDLLDSIKNMAIESIATSLGLSDILENRAHNTGLDFDKEYKNYQEWEKKPIDQRSQSYKAKFVPDTEFKTMMSDAKDLNKSYNRNNLTGDSFKEAHKNLRDKNPDGFKSLYTDEFLKHGEAYDMEHVISVNEVHSDPVMNKFFTNEKKKEFLHSEENFGAAERKINISKNNTKAKDISKWMDKSSKKDPSKSNGEALKINIEKTNETVNTATKKKEELLEKETTFYSTKTTGKIALKNAGKGAAKAALGKLLSITIVEIVNEFKTEEKNELSDKIKNISKRITAKTKDILNTFKDSAITSFISTLLDAILNSLFKIAKNILKFVKTAFNSILKAVKIIFSSEFTWEVKLKEALKILGGAVVILIGVALDEIIEKALISAFPPLASVAGYISPILSGLIVGLASVLIIQAWDTYKDKFILKTDDKIFKLENKKFLVNDLLTNNNVIRANISSFKAEESTFLTKKMFSDSLPIFASLKAQMEESNFNIDLTKISIATKSDEIDTTLDNNQNLLNQLNLI